MTTIYCKISLMSETYKLYMSKLDLTPLSYLKTLIDSSNQKQMPIKLSLPESHICNSSEFKSVGEAINKSCYCAVLIMAGGAATRLGADVPKGQFAINLPGFSCLYEAILNKLKLVSAPHVIFMLSNATVESVSFLKEKNFFGYPAEKVSFVFYPEYPVVSASGELLLDEAHNIQTSPNGNGGFLKAIEELYLTEKYLHVIGVDNAFVQPACPNMLGFAEHFGLNVVNRVLKPLKGEKVGIVGERIISAEYYAPLCPNEICHYFKGYSVPTVFEYSEIDLNKINPENEYANIANHLFKVDYLKYLINIQKSTYKYITPYHLAFKKVPYYDEKMDTMMHPEAPNAYKMEHFIFDYFHFCDMAKFGLFVCDRSEFIPIKEPVDIEKAKAVWK